MVAGTNQSGCARVGLSELAREGCCALRRIRSCFEGCARSPQDRFALLLLERKLIDEFQKTDDGHLDVLKQGLVEVSLLADVAVVWMN
jgi:hypothetical protein